LAWDQLSGVRTRQVSLSVLVENVLGFLPVLDFFGHEGSALFADLIDAGNVASTCKFCNFFCLGVDFVDAKVLKKNVDEKIRGKLSKILLQILRTNLIPIKVQLVGIGHKSGIKS
jgi:hypothetical protein